ncbi:MAG: oligosaccharide flippase family protein [Nitrososphaerota archaeon]|jgi:O-antigen/teichoic acid export membrane protein|nr:oligosaccharide flippase family protein [Nitrososphaerota archaeon]
MSNNLSQVTEDSARGSFFLFSGATIASIILAVSTILMGRFLGPDLYGQYNLVLVIPSLLVLFTDLGMNAGVTKFVASLHAEGKDERIPTIIKYSLLFRIGIGVIISIISIVFASYFALIINRPDFTFYIQLASLSVIFQVIFTNTNSAFVGLDKSEYSALNSTVRAVLTTILQVALVIFSFNVTGALIGYVGGFVVSSVIGSALLFYRVLKSKNIVSQTTTESGRNVLVLLTRYGLPVYVSVVLIGFFPLYQQLVLAFFSSNAAIGNFKAAYNFAILLTTISTALTTAFLPAFSKLESATPQVISAFFNKANKYTCLIIIPITVSAIIFSEPIVNLLYGSTYTSAALFLSLSCSVYLLAIIGSLTLLSVFNGLGKTRLTMNMTLIHFVLLLILTPAFAAFYDVVGVIVASLVSTLVASVYAAVIAHKQLQLKFTFRHNLRIYLISLISAFPPLALLLFTSLNFIVVLLVGGILYLIVFVTLMPLLRIVNKTEIETLAKVTNKLPLVKSIAKPLFSYQHKILRLINGRKQSFD